MNLYHGDCLEILPTFPPASVEAIITDLPYGTTACEWDSIIPLEPMWEQVKRVLKPNGVFVTTASQPFTSVLINSNLDWFKYEWIWEKQFSTGFLHAKNAPLKRHENIVVFSSGVINHESMTDKRMTYHPMMQPGKAWKKKHVIPNVGKGAGHHASKINLDYVGFVKESNGERYPDSILYFGKGNHHREHPFQKPVELYEYLINSYSNPGETILDFCFGSCTTGVAAKQTGRNFIGIEKERKYFEIGKKRYEQAPAPLFIEQPRQPTPLALDNGDSPVLPGFD